MRSSPSPSDGATQTTIRMEREDGTEILRGTAAIKANNPPSALEQRISELSPPETPVILRDVHVGMRTKRIAVRMDADQNMGALYPFSLAQKLQLITEPSPWYTAEGAASSPWKEAIIPLEMVSVLLNYSSDAAGFPVRKPVVGLFADQEIRMHSGPLFVGHAYEMDREVVALSGSRRTESLWIRTRVFQAGGDEVLATMLLNAAYMKDSFPGYTYRYFRNHSAAAFELTSKASPMYISKCVVFGTSSTRFGPVSTSAAAYECSRLSKSCSFCATMNCTGRLPTSCR